MPPTPFPIISSPGIKRDGTLFDDQGFHVDGSWVRWRLGRPRKIPGCISKTNQLAGVPRGMDIFSSGGQNYIECGEANGLQVLLIDQNGNYGGVYDRTPASAFVPSVNNLWQFDQLTNGLGGPATILAHAGQNLMDIDSTTLLPIMYGTAASTSALSVIATTSASCSGGVCAIGPFMFYYGSNGQINNSDANAPATLSGGFANQTNVDAQKVVKGLPVRGGVGNAPAGLFWALDSLILVTFNGNAQSAFNYDFVSHSTSILSSQSVIEDLGTYYWPGIDRFYMWNGSLREIPNELNMDYFFTNLNWAYRQKVFAYKVPRYGEIWWSFPFGTSTECNAYIVYNYRYNTWYDGFWPSSRSSFCYAPTYPYPLVGGTDPDTFSGKFKVWQHEFGTDVVDGSLPPLAINSFYTTGSVAPTGSANATMVTKSSLPVIRGIQCQAITPDFVQTGSMSVQILGRSLANAPDASDNILSFNPPPLSGAAQMTYMKTTQNIMRFKFSSNVQGGNFQDGMPIAWLNVSDGRSVT